MYDKSYFPLVTNIIEKIEMKELYNWEKKYSYHGILIFCLEEEYLDIKLKAL